MTAAEKLEHARTVCAEIGVPLAMLNTLAVDIPMAGQLLGNVSPSTVKRQISQGNLAAFKVGNATRIELTELVDFMERNGISKCRSTKLSARARAIALLDESDV